MIKIVNSDLIQINDDVVVERGPKRVVAIATSDLLHNSNTASHYELGRLDAVGKLIVLGEEMTYLDWLDFFAGNGVWYVYQLVGETHEARGFFDSQAEAIEAGLKL